MVGFWYTIKPRAKGVANNFWFRLALTELEKWPKLPRGACELQPKLLAGSGTGILRLSWAGNEVEMSRQHAKPAYYLNSSGQ